MIRETILWEGQLIFDRITQTLEKEFLEYLLDIEAKKAVRYLHFFSLMILQGDKPPHSLTPAWEEDILKRLATLVKEEIRGTDIIGKIGDDKFLILLDHADFQVSAKIGERVKDRIEHYVFRVDGYKIMLTVSIGVACFPAHASDLGILLEKMETALNIARAQGGSRVCLPDSV